MKFTNKEDGSGLGNSKKIEELLQNQFGFKKHNVGQADFIIEGVLFSYKHTSGGCLAKNWSKNKKNNQQCSICCNQSHKQYIINCGHILCDICWDIFHELKFRNCPECNLYIEHVDTDIIIFVSETTEWYKTKINRGFYFIDKNFANEIIKFDQNNKSDSVISKQQVYILLKNAIKEDLFIQLPDPYQDIHLKIGHNIVQGFYQKNPTIKDIDKQIEVLQIQKQKLKEN